MTLINTAAETQALTNYTIKVRAAVGPRRRPHAVAHASTPMLSLSLSFPPGLGCRGARAARRHPEAGAG